MIIKISTLSIKGDWILGSIVIQVYFIFLFFLWYLWRIQVYGKEAIWKSAEAYCFKIYGRDLRNTASADRRIKCQVRGKRDKNFSTIYSAVLWWCKIFRSLFGEDMGRSIKPKLHTPHTADTVLIFWLKTSFYRIWFF